MYVHCCSVPTLTTRHVEETQAVALDTGMVTAVLRQVPAQPIVFAVSNAVIVSLLVLIHLRDQVYLCFG